MSAVLPMPASPRTTSDRLSPRRTSSISPSSTAHSAARPSSGLRQFPLFIGMVYRTKVHNLDSNGGQDPPEPAEPAKTRGFTRGGTGATGTRAEQVLGANAPLEVLWKETT
jgi:hypothetical protein